MFDSVLGRGAQPPRVLFRGALVSTIVHVAVLGAAVYLSMHAKRAILKPTANPVIKWAQVPPSPPPPGAAAPQPAVQQANHTKRPVKTPDTLVDKQVPQDHSPDPGTSGPEPAGHDAPTCGAPGLPDCGPACGGSGQPPCPPPCGGPGQRACGPACGGVGQAACPPPCGGPGQPCAPAGETVLRFGEGMVRPTLIAGEERPQPTREALMARVEGTIVATCTITTAGDVTNCRLIKSLPHMDEAVIANLQARKYTPVMFQGRPVSVHYNFSFRIVMP